MGLGKRKRAASNEGEGDGPAVGVDLGKTYSCGAVWRGDRGEVIANDQGNRLTPSCVAFADAERLVGEAAVNQAALNPCNTVFEVKRLRGSGPPSPPPPAPPPPESARRVVLYLTSLRGIRRTHDDCQSTSAVLRGYGVRVDERDLSLHAAYKDELRAALGGAKAGLPQVFADGRHLGGAEEVRRMHEDGELAGALEACETASQEACGGCGGVRFVICDTCSGSCKVFVAEDGAGAFTRCLKCNENGLVRCPVCQVAS